MGGWQDPARDVGGEATGLRSPSAGVSAACTRLLCKSRVLKYPRQPGAVPGRISGLRGIRAACSRQPHSSGHAVSWWHHAVASSRGSPVGKLPARWSCQETCWVALGAVQGAGGLAPQGHAAPALRAGLGTGAGHLDRDMSLGLGTGTGMWHWGRALVLGTGTGTWHWGWVVALDTGTRTWHWR